METTFLYLLLNVGTISLPLLRSFESRVRFIQHYKALLAAFFLTSILYIPWDVYFTDLGVWGFNPKYYTGITLFQLPLEEWMFFIFIPYACLFIYEVLNYFFPSSSFWDKIPRSIWAILAVVFVHLAIYYHDQYYTCSATAVAAVFCFIIYFLNPDWKGKFLRSFPVSLIGFLLVNGVLTGTGIEEEVVWYNGEEIIGWRCGTIPLEDFIYCFPLLGLNTLVFEWVKSPSKTPVS